MRTLVVDDELVSRIKLQTFMETYGECHAVDNGHAALDIFRRAWDELLPLDLICLDVEMPGMDGREVLIRIRNMENELGVEHQSRVRVIMVTSQSASANVRSLLQAGCDDYLIKPFEPAKMTQRINRLFIWPQSQPLPTF